MTPSWLRALSSGRADSKANRSRYPNRLRVPGPAQTLRYAFHPERFFAAPWERFGDAFTVRVLSESWVVLGDPAAVEQVLALGPGQASSGEANLALRPLIGARNVLLMDGEEHLARRKLVLPPFHGERMRAYEATIREMAAVEIERLPIGRPEPVLPRMQSLTFAVIVSCVFGVREERHVRELGGALREVLGWVTDIRRAPFLALLGPERLMSVPRFRRGLAALDRELSAEIERRRRAEDLVKREDVLSMLLLARDEEGNGLSDAELRDELVTLLVAGHETTATLLAWALHELCRAPRHQERLAAGESGFADAAIVEALRLRPPVPVFLRRLREPASIAGHDLPAGATLAPSMLLVHRRPDLYQDPWAFEPGRFLGRRPAASEWFPFGGSVRRCLGAAFAHFEARIVLEELSRALRFEPDREPPERVGRRGPVLVPGRGARVVAARR